MSASRKRSTPGPSDSDDYVVKRQKNNAAVNRTREKKRKEENETAEKVEELRKENEQLERKVDKLETELKFLKDLLVNYAKGGRKDNQGPSS